MSEQADISKVETYLVIGQAKRAGGHVEIVVKRTCSRRPKLAPSEIAFRLNLAIPSNIFEAVLPTISAELPEGLALTPEIDTTVAAGE